MYDFGTEIAEMRPADTMRVESKAIGIFMIGLELKGGARLRYC